MSPDIFVYGFLGGFLLNFVYYLEFIKETEPETDINESNETVQSRDVAFKIYGVDKLLFCVVYGLIGGVLAGVFNPQSSLLAFYIGMTAYPTLSKFARTFRPENNLT